MSNDKEVKTIDCTPTWQGLYPLYEEWIKNGTAQQKQLVCDELKRLCAFADVKREKLLDTEKAVIGQNLKSILFLKKDKVFSVKTSWGSKTLIGLYETVLRIVTDKEFRTVKG
jgi:hypothetical protein